jgi:hypothetical protein
VEAWNFQVESMSRTQRLRSDPDLLVKEARWFPVHTAIDLLERYWNPLEIR